MMCEYCKNKQKNKWLVQTDDYSAGVDAKITKLDGVAYLAVSGWYDGWQGGIKWQGGAVGIEAEAVAINYCPMCGRRLCS